MKTNLEESKLPEEFFENLSEEFFERKNIPSKNLEVIGMYTNCSPYHYYDRSKLRFILMLEKSRTC